MQKNNACQLRNAFTGNRHDLLSDLLKTRKVCTVFQNDSEILNLIYWYFFLSNLFFKILTRATELIFVFVFLSLHIFV